MSILRLQGGNESMADEYIGYKSTEGDMEIPLLLYCQTLICLRSLTL